MTAQISDTFLFKGEKYQLIGIAGEGLVTPQNFGMETLPMHTGCYRGFYSTYAINDDGIFLNEITISAKNREDKPINGIMPEKDFISHIATYYNCNLRVPFTGKMRLAKDFIKELYVHMGFQKASAFKTILDLTFEKGYLKNINDRSAEMEVKRGEFKKRYMKDPNQGIYDSFSLDMDLE